MLLPILLAVASAIAAPPVAPHIAVLVEPGMVTYGGTPSTPPDRIPALLRRFGLPAEPITVAQIREQGALTPARYPVLVLPYGNAYPSTAMAALRAYHAGGGSLVLSGVPFCHRCEPDGAGWKDLGHVDAFDHGPTGMGTGGFLGPATGPPTVPPGAGPLGLAPSAFIGRRSTPIQWLDTNTLDPADQVVPLAVLGAGGGPVRPLSAVIRHDCAAFRGAVDVWIGQVASGGDDLDAWLARQLIVRGAALCLAERHAMPAGRTLAGIFAAMDRERKPRPMPAGLAYAPKPRPWGDTYLPKSSAPARDLLLVDATGLPAEARTALSCLQALTSRRQPRFWLRMPGHDLFWLDQHVAQRAIDRYTPVADWKELFERYRGEFKGGIVADPDLYRGELLAVNVAACEDLIVVTPELAQALKIPIRIDLRKRFATWAEGMEWTLRTYARRLSRHLCEFLHPDRLPNGGFAYSMQWRAPVFWIVGPVDAPRPGSDLAAERRVISAMMAKMAPNTAVMGFPYAGEGVGPGEVDGVGMASRYGIALVCTDHLPNQCVTSGVPCPTLSRPAPATAPPLERDRIYVALGLSDGDNQNTWINFMRGYIQHPRAGQFPFAFGMGPPIIDLQPVVARWYFEHAAPSTEFFADVSGIAYMQPDNYGQAYRDPGAVTDGFADWTGRYLKRMGMQTLRTVGGEDDLILRYSRRMPEVRSILADMGRYSGRSGIDDLTYTLETGASVFRAVTSWRYGKDGFLREIREQVGARRPAFVNGFVHCWTWSDLEAVCAIYDARDADMVFVSPSQLAALHSEARRRGWAK